MHVRASERGGQSRDGDDLERERSADAGMIAAGLLESLGIALGPQNEDSETYLEWASDLATYASHLRARSGTGDAPASLHVVRQR